MSHLPSRPTLSRYICSDEDAGVTGVLGFLCLWFSHSLDGVGTWAPRGGNSTTSFWDPGVTVCTGDMLADLGISLGLCSCLCGEAPDASASLE